jgi:hypothetical protein
LPFVLSTTAAATSATTAATEPQIARVRAWGSVMAMGGLPAGSIGAPSNPEGRLLLDPMTLELAGAAGDAGYRRPVEEAWSSRR